MAKKAKAAGRTAVTGSKRVTRRKPDDARKEALIRIRVTPQQKDLLVSAAERAGLDVSGWLRSIGLERAREMATAVPAK